MDKSEILFRLRALNISLEDYLVCGGAPLAMAGLHDADDIDLFVTPGLYAKLQRSGWQPYQKVDSNHIGLVYDVFEAHAQWKFAGYSAAFIEQYSSANIVDGIRFMNLQETIRWKRASGRPKDIVDIALIDDYLNRS